MPGQRRMETATEVNLKMLFFHRVGIVYQGAILDTGAAHLEEFLAAVLQRDDHLAGVGARSP